MNGDFRVTNLENWNDPQYNRASLIQPATTSPIFPGPPSSSLYGPPPGLFNFHNAPFVPAGPPNDFSRGQNDRDRGLGSEVDLQAKERNKAAQRAYRQRTKAKAEGNEKRIKDLEKQLAHLRLETEGLQQKNSLLEANQKLRLAEAREQAEPDVGEVEFRPADGWDELKINSTLVLTKAQDKGPLRLTSKEITELPENHLFPIWKTYINRMAMALLEANGDENSPAGKELKTLVYEVTALGSSIALKNPGLRHSLVTKSLDEGSALALTSLPDWAAITRSLQLSPTQKRELLNLRQNFLSIVGSLRAERRRLVEQLHQMAAPDGDLTAKSFSEQLYHAFEACDQLRANLDQQHSYTCNFIGCALRRCLKPIQIATFLVTAYPWGPDMLAMLQHVAGESSDAFAVMSGPTGALQLLDAHKEDAGL